MTSDPVTIERDKKIISIEHKDLVVGDRVFLQPGDQVPADLKLIEARGLEVDAFEMTGELLPVKKAEDDEDPTLYMGSRIVKGSGKGVVIAVGSQTEFGKVSQEGVKGRAEDWLVLFEIRDAWWLVFTLPLLPLLLTSTDYLLLGLLYYLMAIGMFLLVKHQGLQQRLLIRLFSKPLCRMGVILRSRNVLSDVNDIRLVCLDKTGVLTTREMQVNRLGFFGGIVEGSTGLKNLDDNTSGLVIKGCALCHDTWFYERIETGHPLDRAIIQFAQAQGADLDHMLRTYERIFDQPFTSDNRYMVCGYQHDTQGEIYLMKGEPHIVRTKSRYFTTMDGESRLIGVDFLRDYREFVDLSDRSGHKTITLAYATEKSALETNSFTILCVLQLTNSLQPGVRDVIDNLSQRKIRSLLLTGDSLSSAIWAAEQSGIGKHGQGFLTGSMLDRMSFDEIRRQIKYCAIFARLIPSQKGILVRLLQNKDTKVAMVGDGFNDGIALKVADLGFSFQISSSATARQFSDILLHEFGDLVKVFECAKRYKKAAAGVNVFRKVAIVVFSMVIYGWVWWYLMNAHP